MDPAASTLPVSPLIPPLVSFAISLLTTSGGVSGAFLLLPFQMSVLGFTSPAVSATNQLYNVVAIPSGVLRYIREGRMVWPLAWVVIAGTLPGVLIGALVRVSWLPDPRHFKAFAGAVLLYLGVRLVLDLIRPTSSGAAAAERRFFEQSREGSGPTARVRVRHFSLSRIRYEFQDEVFDFSTPGIFALAFVVGIVGGVYGIGGGAIMAPFFVAFFHLPVYTIAGAALLGTLVTSVAGVGFYHAIAPLYPHLQVAPDWRLGLLFGVGGMAGMYLGARLQKHLPARLIKAILALLVGLLGIGYLVALFR